MEGTNDTEMTETGSMSEVSEGPGLQGYSAIGKEVEVKMSIDSEDKSLGTEIKFEMFLTSDEEEEEDNYLSVSGDVNDVVNDASTFKAKVKLSTKQQQHIQEFSSDSDQQKLFNEGTPELPVPPIKSESVQPSTSNNSRHHNLRQSKRKTPKKAQCLCCPEKSESSSNKPQSNNIKQEQTHSCPICSKSFKYASTLARHELAHKPTRLCQCDRCGKLFKRTDHLAYHLKIHSNHKEFQCHQCGKQFPVLGGLNCHLTMHLKDSQREAARAGWKYRCPICHEKLQKIGHLDQHFRIHKIKRSVTPDLPKNEASSSSGSTGDTKVHGATPCFNCDQCGEKFKLESSFKTHLKMHSNSSSAKPRPISAPKESTDLELSECILV